LKREWCELANFTNELMKKFAALAKFALKIVTYIVTTTEFINKSDASQPKSVEWIDSPLEKNMSIQLVIEMPKEQTAQSVMRALESYKARLRNSVERTRRRLADFETRYQVTTAQFLKKMTAEDLAGGDLEYVEWAGEAKLLAGLEDELGELEHAHYQLP
jgi:hypothetical protein